MILLGVRFVYIWKRVKRKQCSTVCTFIWVYFDGQRSWGGAETNSEIFSL